MAGRSQVVRRAHRPHKGVGRPHGEVHGKGQAEHHQLGAGVFPHVGEIHAHQVHHFTGEKILQHLQNARHVQLQKAQQGADKDQKWEDGKQQVKGQCRALDAHAMAQIPAEHQINTPQKGVFRHRGLPHGHRLLSSPRLACADFPMPHMPSPLIPTCSTRPDSSPPWPPARCGRWACGKAPGAPAASPPGPGA